MENSQNKPQIVVIGSNKKLLATLLVSKIALRTMEMIEDGIELERKKEGVFEIKKLYDDTDININAILRKEKDYKTLKRGLRETNQNYKKPSKRR